jgi:paraquat-inducible protein B
MKACLCGNPSTTKLLLDRGCTVNYVNDDGYTALHCACSTGCTKCIKELLAHGADTSIKDQDGKTPFDVAKAKEHEIVIDLLIKHKYYMDLNNQHEKKSVLSKVSIPKAAVCCEQLSSKVKDVSQRCEELHDRIASIASNQEEMNQTVQKLTSDFESKIEALRSEIRICAANQDKKLSSQLTISNAEVAKCISKLCTIVENLSLKVTSSSQAHHDSNEETTIIEEHGVGEDDFEMIP